MGVIEIAHGICTDRLNYGFDENTLMRIFYCICDSKFSFHPLAFSNGLFYLWKIFSFLSAKWVRVRKVFAQAFTSLDAKLSLYFLPYVSLHVPIEECRCLVSIHLLVQSFFIVLQKSHVYSTSFRWQKKILSSIKNRCEIFGPYLLIATP